MAMTWSDIAKTAETIAGGALPVLGGALGGPLGAQAGSVLASALGLSRSASPTEVQQALLASPEAAVKLRQIESDERIALASQAAQTVQEQLRSDQASIEAVNATIRASETGKSWLQQNTQSICKLSTVAAVIAVYFVLPLLNRSPPPVPETVWGMLAVILGVTSWHAGVADVEKVKQAGAAANNITSS